MEFLILILIASVAALTYAAVNYFQVKKLDEGTERMSQIAKAIRIGANAFINYEYKIIAIVAAVVTVLLAVLVSWYTGVAFLIGATMSALAGWVGMKIATYSNVRVSNVARETNSLGKTLKVAFKGGSVMGLCVAGFALLGLVIVYLVFGYGFDQLHAPDVTSGLLGIEIIPFTMTLSGYSLGCSIIAMFNRVGGGIYTKAADMGADLVGKTEAHIPEDDPRNPATIADNVGDNVGDVAGLGSDLCESYVGSIVSAVILIFHIFVSRSVSGDILDILFIYPVLFAACGLLSCIIGIGYLLCKKNVSENPHSELNIATWISAGLTIVLGGLLTYFFFKNVDVTGANIDFNLGIMSPWITAVIGIISGVAIGMIAEHYTSYDYKPTRKISVASKEGPALTITQGLAVGMISTMAPIVVLAFATYISYVVAGYFGVAMAAIGMLSFVATTVGVDTYGPIADNAGGISEMAKLDEKVRTITDKLDSVGNTTAAIGKGFAIGSASLATLSLMVAYLFACGEKGALALNIIDPLTLAGALVGSALPYLFSGMLIEAVTKAARKMVVEVRRQFDSNPEILKGECAPDYKTCIEISSQGALSEMKVPALVAILFPILTGFLFGELFVGGVLIGATLSAIMLAIYSGNSGGAWDNAKKYIETGAVEGEAKGGSAHDAAVVGDTVGDPLKDTVGPSLDILIKIMATISLVIVPLFEKYNLLDWILNLF